MRILVVDDERDLREITALRLEGAGFEVLQAEDAVQALALLKDPNHVDVLFTDIVMPGMSGIELSQAARTNHEGLRVVLTSGYAPPDVPLPLRMQFLPKPYKFADVITAISQAN